ncbi:MAG: adenosylcobinamide-GDP ribazoletransferase [Rhodomicrobiaceae bacterium]
MKPASVDMESETFLRRRLEELGLAAGLLTRIPLPAFKRHTRATLGTAFWAYPLVGALIGVLSAIAFWLSVTAGFSSTACAYIAIIASLLAGGAFHEDGLSDLWDGLGGGKTKEAKLKIMRDSRIGAYGALALLLTLGLQAEFIVNLQHYTGLLPTIAAIIAAETLARGVIALPLATLPPARKDGLGSLMTNMRPETYAAAIAISLVVAFVLLGLNSGMLILGGAIGAAVITLLARSFLGGFTGDVLGATAATARMTALGFVVLLVTP